MALDLALGDPPSRWHPVAWIGRALAAGRRRLAQGSPARLLLGGAALTVGVATAAGLGAAAIAVLAWRLGVAGMLLEAVALKSMLAVRGLGRAAGQVARALERGDLVAARRGVGRDLVSRPTTALDEGHVASAAIESVAENVTDSVVAPLVFYALFGLAGAAVYRTVNTADAMIGYREGVLEHFGKTAARLDDALNLVPARLATALLVLAAPVGGGAVTTAVEAAWRDHRRTASPNAGWTMSAMAGALGVTLEKGRALPSRRSPRRAAAGRARRRAKRAHRARGLGVRGPAHDRGEVVDGPRVINPSKSGS